MNCAKKGVTGFLLFVLIISAASFTIISGKRKLVADKKESLISYTMIHPLHEWTGTSHDVNCIALFNEDSNAIESVAVSVSLSTFDSKNSNRDSHALEVLEAIAYPNVKFTSQSIQQNGDKLTLEGTLFFHNVSKPVTIFATRENSQGKLNVKGTFKVDITDYQVPVPSLMGLKTDKEIIINFNIEFSL